MADNQMRLSMVIAADASGVAPATREARREVEGVGESARNTASALEAQARASDEAAAAARRAAEAARAGTEMERQLRQQLAQAAGASATSVDASSSVAQRQYREELERILQTHEQWGLSEQELAGRLSRANAVLAEQTRVLQINTAEEKERIETVQRVTGAYDAQAAAISAAGAATGAANRQMEEYLRLAAAGREAYAATQAQRQFNVLMGVRDPSTMKGSAQASASVFADMPADAAKNIALANHEMTNLTYQMNDIVMMLASGQSPFLMMMQQGSQVTQIMGQRGLGQVLPALGQALVSLVSPTTLFLAGITAAGYAGYAAFRMIVPEAKRTEDVLQSLTDAARELEEAYKRADKGAREMSKGMSLSVARTLADIKADDAKEHLTAGGRQIFGDVMGNASFLSQILPKQMLAAYSRLGPIYDAVMQLNEEAKNGVPNFERYSAALSEIANDRSVAEGIRDRAKSLLEEGQLLAATYREWVNYQKQLDAAGQRGPLIGSSAEDLRNRYLDDQRLALRNAQSSFEAEMQRLEARSPIERAAAARALEEVREPPAGESSEVRNQRIELAGTRALIEAEHELAEAQRERNRALDETIQSAQLDVDLIGKSTAEAERLRLEHQLIAEVRRQAAVNGVAADEAEIERIRKLSAEYGKLRAIEEARSLLRNQGEDMLRLHVEQQLAGTSDAFRNRAMAQLDAERDIRQIGLDPNDDLAEKIRQGAIAAADMRTEVERQEAAWDAVKQAGESAIDSFVDKLSNGDVKGALKGIGDDLLKTALQLEVANPLKNWIFGGNNPTGADLGGNILGRLFGGADANASTALSSLFGGQSVGAMTVNAGSVIVTGSIGVGGGLGGLMGNVERLLAGGNDNASGGDVASTIWNFFSAKGLAPHQVAGIMGNVGAESSFNPAATNPSSGAFGLFQHLGPRLLGLGDGADLTRQLQFAWQELQSTESGVLQRLLSAGDVRSATGAFAGFERAEGWTRANPEGIALWDQRLNIAQETLERFTGTADNAIGGLGQLGKGADALGNGLNQFGNMLNAAPTGGGGGGLLGMIGGLFGGGGASLSPAAWNVVSSGGMTGLFDSGGWTGPGGKFEPAGIVHKDEFVFSAEATRSIGVSNLYALHDAAKRGFAEGGFAVPGAAAYGGGNVVALPDTRGQSSGGGVFRIIIEEGPMFRSTIRSEAQDQAVEIVRANEDQREDRYWNGGHR